MGTTLALSLALSGIIGVALGVFGGGGSILAVPVLVYVTQVTPAAAIAMSLAIVGATSLMASYAHHRRGLVHGRVALLFGGSGVVTAFLGARLTHLVSGRVLMFTFAALMMLVGLWMLFGQRRSLPNDGDAGGPRPQLSYALLAGAAVGAITGFLGVGGGFLVVPALIAFTGLDMRGAVGTSLLIIAINSGAGFLGHLSRDRLDFQLVISLTLAAIFGALAGECLGRRVPVHKLRGGFALFVLLVGIGVAVKSAT
ncbi:MAG: sulfite exporter TauE/SafE family protein [Polyangiaceae bacterium]